MKLKTGDKVTVIAGANKGKNGKVLKVLNDKVIVEGVNVIKKHLKPKNNGGNGEIIEVEAPIHRSNLKLVSAKTTKNEASKATKKEDTKTSKTTKKAKKEDK